MDLNSMPVDILEYILLCLDCPISLIRASSACKLWRHIIAGTTVFVQRFRALQEPPAVGSYHNVNGRLSTFPRFEPALPPTTSIDSRHVSLDFLPMINSPWTLEIKDSRGSLLLVESVSFKDFRRHQYMYVCEPMTRRFQEVAKLVTTPSCAREFQAFLLEGAEPGDIAMSNFRVVCLSKRGGDEAGILTSGGPVRKVSISNQGEKMICIGSAAGCMYWYIRGESGIVFFALDQSTAQFSSFLLPGTEDFAHATIPSMFAVTTGRDGKARIVFLGGGEKLRVFARQQDGNWVQEKGVWRLTATKLGLPSNQKFSLARSVPFSVETMGTVRIVVASQGDIVPSCVYKLDIEKMRMKPTENNEKPYLIKLPWPPTFHACIDPIG